MEKLVRYKGRPEDVSGRQEKEIRVYDFLDELGIEYFRLDHEPADSDHPEVCEAVDEALGAKICKNLFLANRQRTKFYMLMIPADKVFRSSDISKQAGSSRLHFAEPEYMERFLDTTPGSASVMGLINDSENDVQLLVDQDVISAFLKAVHHDYIVVHAQ